MTSTDLAEYPAINNLITLSRRLQECCSAQDTSRWIHESFSQAYGPAALMIVGTRDLPAGTYALLRLSLDESAWAEDALLSPARQPPLYRDGVIGHITATPQPKLINDVDWSSDPYFHDALCEFGSLMAIPVTGRNLRATWVILLKRGPARYTMQDLEGALVRAVLAASLIDSQELAGALAFANHRIEAEMHEVGELQRSLLPNPLPKIPGIDWAASYRPSGRAGGDLYDIFPLNAADGPFGPWCIFIGDASGHGIASAVVITMIHSILHAHPSPINGPAELLSYANRNLCRKNLSGFVTGFLAFYHPISRRLTYASAGHPPTLLRTTSDGNVKRLDQATGYPLGIDCSQKFIEADLQLRRGDSLLFYTDGITEARGHNRDLLNIERLEFAFAQDERKPAERKPAEKLHRLCKMIEHHQPPGKPHDDQTMIVVEMI